MNKKVIPLLIISSFLLSGCDIIDSFIHYGEQDFVPEEKDEEEPSKPEEVTFNISSAELGSGTHWSTGTNQLEISLAGSSPNLIGLVR